MRVDLNESTLRSRQRIRVLVVDDSQLIGELLKVGLRRQADLVMLGWASDVGEASCKIDSWRPDVILLNRRMGGDRSLETLRELKNHFPQHKVVVFNLTATESEMLACLEAGASAYVLTDALMGDLAETIRAVHRDQWQCPLELLPKLLSRLSELSKKRGRRQPEEVVVRLTPCERRILRLADQGWTNQQIADHLAVTLSTVKNQLHQALQKLDVKHRWQAVRRATELGLLDE
jgi:DNA-binding NarL/FixJ family response regulator